MADRQAAQVGISNPTGPQVNAGDAPRRVTTPPASVIQSRSKICAVNRAAGRCHCFSQLSKPCASVFGDFRAAEVSRRTGILRYAAPLHCFSPNYLLEFWAFPPIRQRRVAVEDNLAGGQGGFQLFVPLFRNHRVIEAQRLEMRHCLKRCDAGVGDVCRIEPQFPQSRKRLQRIRGSVANRSVVQIETSEIFERCDGCTPASPVRVRNSSSRSRLTSVRR